MEVEREDKMGSSRASRGAACPSDCAEADAQNSDGGRGPDDTPWIRADVEKPIYDGYGERFLLTWCTRSGTYDIGCIDGNWTPGETIDISRGELWRWLDVNPERHLPPPPSDHVGGEG